MEILKKQILGKSKKIKVQYITRMWELAIKNNNTDDIKVLSNFAILTKIRPGAFLIQQLQKVIIPDSVTTIGDGAFGSNYLKEIIIPSSVTTIGDGAFAKNDLRTIKIPDYVTTIGDGAFANNK